MLFPEEDATALKTWIVKRLETPERTDGDVDADVLADYVLALLRHDGKAADVRQLCETELYDFLKEEAKPFVDDVFQAVTYQSYKPGARPPSTLPPPPARGLSAAVSGAVSVSLPGPGLPGAPPLQDGARKRSFHESSIPSAATTFEDAEAGGREFKKPRQRRNGRDVAGPLPPGFNMGVGVGMGLEGLPLPPSLPPPPFAGGLGSLPPVPSNGAAPYDAPALSMEAMLQMQQMGMPVPLYGFPWGASGNGNNNHRRRRRRCRFFEKSGYCTKPDCPFEHVRDGDPGLFPMLGALGVPGAMLPHMLPAPPPGGSAWTRKGGRAPFSAEGPVYDRKASTIVVEGIPDDHLNETAVREFFGQFGPITKVTMQTQKKLAIVQFDSWGAANAAYQSPKVIFDNRFVKVFWYKEDDPHGAATAAKGDKSSKNSKSGKSGKSGNTGEAMEEGEVAEEGEADENEDEDGEPALDMDEFLQRQAEAQKRHEDKERKKRELAQQRQELEERQRALQARQATERQRLVAKMAAVATRARQVSEPSTPGTPGTPGTPSGAAISQTEMIRAQLAALEDEARQLGLDPDSAEGGAPPSWRGRGGGRGRGRGGRGAYAGRGRGSLSSAYAAYSLDNRPRRVAVTGVDFTAPAQDEALRQYLLVVGEFAAMDTTAETTTITFLDRRTAEKFFYGLVAGKPGGKRIPGVAEPVEVSWVAGAAPGGGGGNVPRSAGTRSTDGTAAVPTERLEGSSNGVSATGAAASNDGDGDDDNNNSDVDLDTDGDVDMEGDKHKHHGGTFAPKQPMDFDVADEGDWDIG